MGANHSENYQESKMANHFLFVLLLDQESFPEQAMGRTFDPLPAFQRDDSGLVFRRVLKDGPLFR